MKLFVPGRICLFGEHSDWAGGCRRINGELEKGYTLITGTDQGIYADVKPHPSKLVYRASLNDGSTRGPIEMPMDREALLAEAEKGGFFSYIAGAAYQVLTHYRVRGLEIDNYLTDLPIKKGLSSSAALSVLIVRAFNRTYDLKMTVRGEMEYAYLGEITTPSRCGRMDQGCAYGHRPVLMTFDGDKIDVEEIRVDKDLHLVIVDLHAGKDTKEILSRLNKCYPFAENDLQKKVQHCLGPINARIVHQAVRRLKAGDGPNIGALMKSAQDEFDANLQPACPSQLTAPVLHRVLHYEPVQPYILGGKGVGSQGDGSAQFIVKDEACQKKVIEILEKDLDVSCLKLTMRASRGVRKAVIPAAGFGTRLFPASKAIKKELFPIVDRHGKVKPVIMTIVEEAVDSGIEEVAIIVQESDRASFEEFFRGHLPIEHYNKLSPDHQKESRYIRELGHRITFLTQEEQEGFGHAVYCARQWVGAEPFLLLLGDHLYSSDADAPCARQVMETYQCAGKSVVGLKKTPAEKIKAFGCVSGAWKERDSILSITEFIEKPDLDYARTHLRVEGLEEESFLTIFGIYVLTPDIFDYLEEHITHNIREKGEFQLTSCLEKLRKENGFTGCVVKGKCFDIGLPDAYRQTLIDFPNA